MRANSKSASQHERYASTRTRSVGKMRRVVCRTLGTDATLEMEDVSSVMPGSGDLQVAVYTSSINRNEALKMRGNHHEQPALPYTPGSDVAGVVASVGAGVSNFVAGDRVLGVTHTLTGGWAEEAIVEASWAVKLPNAISFVDAATYTSSYITAYDALVHAADTKATDTVLVTGAGGGVGLAAVQLARCLGATVIAVAGGDERLAAARAAGAHHVLDRRAVSVRDSVKALTSGKGADVAVEVIGGDTLLEVVRCMAWRGRLVVAGFASGELPNIRSIIVLLKAFDLRGANLYRTLINCPGRFAHMAEQIFCWQKNGQIRPQIARCFRLDDANQAVHYAEQGNHRGKVIMKVRESA